MFPYNIISLLLLGYICRVRALQNENSKLCHQIGIVEESKRAEITNLKDLYDQQVTYPTSGIIKNCICYVLCLYAQQLFYFTHFSD